MQIRHSLKVWRTTLAGIALGLAAAHSAQAQAPAANWPAKPLRIIVSFAPGGLTDTIARALQPRLTEGLGQQVIIENRPGAGGALAEAALAHSAPDGYTILLSADGVPATPHLVSNPGYDTFKDLMPVSLLMRIPLVLLVNPSVPSNSVKEFVNYARVNPGKIAYASPGNGTSNHLFFEVFKDMAKFDVLHVAFKGGNPAMTDLIGGHVQAMLISSTLAVPQVAGGKVKALAVTSEKRSPQMPNVPTFAEAGYPDFKPQQWIGLFLPAGTPSAIAKRLHAEFDKAIKTPDVAARLRDLGAEPVMSTQAHFADFLREEHNFLGKLIRSRNISAQ